MPEAAPCNQRNLAVENSHTRLLHLCSGLPATYDMVGFKVLRSDPWSQFPRGDSHAASRTVAERSGRNAACHLGRHRLAIRHPDVGVDSSCWKRSGELANVDQQSIWWGAEILTAVVVGRVLTMKPLRGQTERCRELDGRPVRAGPDDLRVQSCLTRRSPRALPPNRSSGPFSLMLILTVVAARVLGPIRHASAGHLGAGLLVPPVLDESRLLAGRRFHSLAGLDLGRRAGCLRLSSPAGSRARASTGRS